jgi:hypothetical protein
VLAVRDVYHSGGDLAVRQRFDARQICELAAAEQTRARLSSAPA